MTKLVYSRNTFYFAVVPKFITQICYTKWFQVVNNFLKNGTFGLAAWCVWQVPQRQAVTKMVEDRMPELWKCLKKVGLHFESEGLKWQLPLPNALHVPASAPCGGRTATLFRRLSVIPRVVRWVSISACDAQGSSGATEQSHHGLPFMSCYYSTNKSLGREEKSVQAWCFK
jgi:hypothetical protein